MYEAKTFAPSTRFGQNFGTEYGHSIDMFSSSATYHYPNPTKSKWIWIQFEQFVEWSDVMNFSEPDDISYSGSSRKRRKKGGKRHRQSQERSNSSHINPNYDLPSLAFFVILIAKNLFPWDFVPFRLNVSAIVNNITALNWGLQDPYLTSWGCPTHYITRILLKKIFIKINGLKTLLSYDEYIIICRWKSQKPKSLSQDSK